MKISTHRPAQPEATSAAPVQGERTPRSQRRLAQAEGTPGAISHAGQGPLQAKAAVDTGYDGIVTLARAHVPRRPDATGMPAPVREKMEAAFGDDFSGVRVHPGSSRATALGAMAYTQGSEIHVAPGHWAPETRAGQALLGHELAHVVQQRTGRVRATAQHNGVALNDDPSLEAEADVLGARAATAGEGAAQRGRAPAEAKADAPASTCAGATQRKPFPGGMEDANHAPLGGGLELKRKYYYAAMLAPVRKLAMAKPKPGVWNKDLQVSEEQGSFTFDIIEPFNEAAWDGSDPVREAERRADRDAKRKSAHDALKQWQKEYAAYQKSGYFTPDQISQESLRSHGEEIASGLEGQLGYVDDQGSDEAAQREAQAAAQRAARIERDLARMGVASGNQITFVIAKHGDTIVAIGSAHGGYIDHVVASPDSQLPREHRPGGTASGGGRAVTHKMMRLMIKKGIRPTVSPVSPRAKEGLSRYFAPPPQRKAAPLETGDEGLRAASQAALRHSAGPRALPAELQLKMESAFEADFSNIRVHHGSSRATTLGARSCAQGDDIHVAPGQWAPGTRAGQELIGHELAHVMQQRGGRVRPTTAIAGVAINDDPALEAEADALGARAARGQCLPSIPARGGRASSSEPVQRTRKRGATVDTASGGKRPKRADQGEKSGIMVKCKVVGDSEFGRARDLWQAEQEWIDVLYNDLDSTWDPGEKTAKTEVLHFQFSWGAGVSSEASPDLYDVLRERLDAKYELLHQEAAPRAGKSRAAADSDHGKERPKWSGEASYKPATSSFETARKDDITIGKSAFKAERKSGSTEDTLVSTVRHEGPWAKGDRGSGQSQVMGGQNASNYVLDNRPDLAGDIDKEGARKTKLKGRYEWLHIIGSSLGGLNTPNNLVAGSYDRNTEMIPLEHRVALWGSKEYQNSKGDFKPTQAEPITVAGEAAVYPGTNVGKSITLEVSHGTKSVAKGKYDVEDQTVLTKKQYEAEEARVDGAIKKARP